MRQEILAEARGEANSLRLLLNPMNIICVTPNSIRPLSKSSCLHAVCLIGSNSMNMKRFMTNHVKVAVPNDILHKTNEDVQPFTHIVDKEWPWIVSVGRFNRQYKYLTPLEYYLIHHPEKVEEVLQFVKNISNDLIL